MKNTFTLLTMIFIFSSIYGQTEPNNQTELSKKMPPMSMLKGTPGEVKHIYELPNPMDYKIYNLSGNLIQYGNAEFIDYTHYRKGVYFISYGDKKETFEVTE